MAGRLILRRCHTQVEPLFEWELVWGDSDPPSFFGALASCCFSWFSRRATKKVYVRFLMSFTPCTSCLCSSSRQPCILFHSPAPNVNKTFLHLSCSYFLHSFRFPSCALHMYPL